MLLNILFQLSKLHFKYEKHYYMNNALLFRIVYTFILKVEKFHEVVCVECEV